MDPTTKANTARYLKAISTYSEAEIMAAFETMRSGHQIAAAESYDSSVQQP